MAFTPNIPTSNRFLAFIYGGSGVGKSTAYFSLLKNPKLKLVVFALDPTTDFAMQNCFNLFGIEDLNEGQLIYVKPDVAKLGSTASTLDGTDSTFLTNIINNIHNSVGFDAKTGAKVSLKGIDNQSTFNENTVLVFDGFSNFVLTCEAKAKSMSVTQNGNFDTMKAFKVEKALIKGLTNKIITSSSCHIIFCGHEQQSDAEAVAKYESLTSIHPYTGVRSLVSSICGDFSFVFYAKRNSLTNKFSLSVAENKAFVRDKLDRIAFSKFAEEFNKDKKPVEKISLSELPQDLTHPCYNGMI